MDPRMQMGPGGGQMMMGNMGGGGVGVGGQQGMMGGMHPMMNGMGGPGMGQAWRQLASVIRMTHLVG